MYGAYVYIGKIVFRTKHDCTDPLDFQQERLGDADVLSPNRLDGQNSPLKTTKATRGRDRQDDDKSSDRSNATCDDTTTTTTTTTKWKFL